MHEILSTWINLNDALRGCSEDFCHKLLKAEMSGKKRKTFINRIHSRLNKVRADRERIELMEKVDGKMSTPSHN